MSNRKKERVPTRNKLTENATPPTKEQQTASFAGLFTVEIIVLLAIVILICLWNFFAAFASLRTHPSLPSPPIESELKSGGGGGGGNKEGEETSLSLLVPFHRLTAKNYQPFATTEEQDAHFISQDNLYPETAAPEEMDFVKSRSAPERNVELQAFLQPGMHSFGGEIYL
jgi:hypothetical protein